MLVPLSFVFVFSLSLSVRVKNCILTCIYVFQCVCVLAPFQFFPFLCYSVCSSFFSLLFFLFSRIGSIIIICTDLFLHGFVSVHQMVLVNTKGKKAIKERRRRRRGRKRRRRRKCTNEIWCFCCCYCCCILVFGWLVLESTHRIGPLAALLNYTYK